MSENQGVLAIRNFSIRPAAWLAAAAALLAVAARLIPGPRTIDDAYITFRYARNLLSGLGFTYNPGQAVLGTTTPLYTLLMALLALPSGGAQAPFPVLALALNTLADALTCLLLWQIGKRLGSERAGLAASFVWAVAPYSVTFAIGGLETSVYVLLLTALVWAYLTKRRALTGLAAALAVLTRPDALILVGPLILDRLYCVFMRKNRTPADRLTARELLAFLLPAGAWIAYAIATFGSPLPHSITAKLVTYRLPPADAFIRLLQHYATPFLEEAQLGPVMIAFGLLVFPFLYMVGARRAWKAEPRALAALLYPLLYFITFSLPNPLLFRWYLTPPLPLYFLAILLGADQLLSVLATRILRTSPSPALLLPILLLWPLGFSLGGWTLHPDHGPDRPAPDMAWFKLELLYRQAADTIAPFIPPGGTLAAGDVGVLGYFTGAQILDTVGLNSPESLAYYPLDPIKYVINYAIPTELILDQRPDAVVILEVYGRLTFLADPRFAEQYELVETIQTDIYGSNGMLLYRRKP